MRRARVPLSARAAIGRAVQRQMDAYDGQLPNEVVRQLAAAHQVSESTIKRIRADLVAGLDPGAPRESGAVVLSKDDLATIGQYHTNLRAAWRQRCREGYAHSYDTFVRAFKALDPLQQIALKEGGHAAAAKSLKVRQTVDGRLEVVHYDHTMADLDVAHRNAKVRPWVTFFIDAWSRFLLAMAITFGDGIGGDPNTEVIVACLSQMLLGFTEDEVRYGGIPVTILYDNAKAHSAEAVRNGCQDFGIISRPIPPASPWLQGKVEAFVDTFTTEFLVGKPGYTGGAPDRYGRDTGRKGPLLNKAQFVALAGAWAHDYNFTRPHSALGGLTPAQQWNLGKNALEFIDEDEAALHFLGDPKPRTVDSYGVRFDKIDFTDPVLNYHIGEDVLIRYLPSLREFVHVHTLSGEFLCKAEPHDRLSVEARAEMHRYSQSVDRFTVTVEKTARDKAQRRAVEELQRLGFAGVEAQLVDLDAPQAVEDPTELFISSDEASTADRLGRLEAALKPPTERKDPER